MGFPLRSNVFRPGTAEQRFFSRFPIQVAVLCSPDDRQFVSAFRDVFLQLDRLTGDDLAFFAVLDPPADWLNEARARQWWQAYEAQTAKTGFSYDDKVLVHEIARLFRVSWAALPSIVVGTDLWSGEFVTCPTSAWHITRQLEALTTLVREWGQPNIAQIDDALNESVGLVNEHHVTDDRWSTRLGHFFGALETAGLIFEHDPHGYRRYVDWALAGANGQLRTIRRSRQSPDRDRMTSNDEQSVDRIVDDAAGRLVAPATVAMYIARRLRDAPGMHVSAELEEESGVMIDQALRIGAFLEQESEFAGRRDPFMEPIGQRQRTASQPGRGGARWEDFTGAAQGAWKAFELEVNLSPIQAAREARGVRMPEFWARYCAAITPPAIKVRIAEPGAPPGRRDLYESSYRRPTGPPPLPQSRRRAPGHHRAERRTCRGFRPSGLNVPGPSAPAGAARRMAGDSGHQECRLSHRTAQSRQI